MGRSAPARLERALALAPSTEREEVLRRQEETSEARHLLDVKPDLRLVFLGGYEDIDRESAQDMEQSLNAWDGAAWVAVGGEFEYAGDTASNSIACWTGATPTSLIFADGFETGDTSAWAGP